MSECLYIRTMVNHFSQKQCEIGFLDAKDLIFSVLY